MSFSLGYVATIIFKKIQSSNEAISPYNALNVKAYNYALKIAVCCYKKWVTALLKCLKIIVLIYILATVTLTIILFCFEVLNGDMAVYLDKKLCSVVAKCIMTCFHWL